MNYRLQSGIPIRTKVFNRCGAISSVVASHNAVCSGRYQRNLVTIRYASIGRPAFFSIDFLSWQIRSSRCGIYAMFRNFKIHQAIQLVSALFRSVVRSTTRCASICDKEICFTTRCAPIEDANFLRCDLPFSSIFLFDIPVRFPRI